MKPIKWLGLFGALCLLAGCVDLGDEGFAGAGFGPGDYGMDGPMYDGGYADGPSMYAPSFGYMGGFNGGFGGGFIGGDDDDDD